jgi:hypothetical protein
MSLHLSVCGLVPTLLTIRWHVANNPSQWIGCAEINFFATAIWTAFELLRAFLTGETVAAVQLNCIFTDIKTE